MGKKKTTTKQSNTPLYSSQIEGAANAQQAAYQRQQPVLQQFSDNAAGISDDLFARYREGNPLIDQAQGYASDVLSMEPGDNPYLQGMIDQTNDSLQNRIRTRMGSRGNLGGTVELGILADELSKNELGLRYQDYDRTLGRQAQAASLAPGLVTSELIPLDAALKTGAQGAMLPLQASLANSAGVGGLLGQYQNVEGEQTQKRGFGDWLGLGLQGIGLFAGG